MCTVKHLAKEVRSGLRQRGGGIFENVALQHFAIRIAIFGAQDRIIIERLLLILPQAAAAVERISQRAACAHRAGGTTDVEKLARVLRRDRPRTIGRIKRSPPRLLACRDFPAPARKDEQVSGGRMGEKPSNDLAKTLESFDLPLGRLKTGTPPRLDGRWNGSK